MRAAIVSGSPPRKIRAQLNSAERMRRPTNGASDRATVSTSGSSGISNGAFDDLGGTLSRPPDAGVVEPGVARRFGGKQIASVHQDGPRHHPSQASQVEQAELLPLGHQHQSIGIGGDFLGGFAEADLEIGPLFPAS